MDAIKEKIKNGQVIFGTHVINEDPFNAEIISQMGFDYIFIDMEHTEIEKSSLNAILMATNVKGSTAKRFVRVSSNDPNKVKPVLDMGADGIIFPMIRTKEDVDLAVASCTYPPEGIRGFSPKRPMRYGLDPALPYINGPAKEIWKIIQIETREAYEHLDDICSNPAVDAYLIGPADSSGAFGHLMDFKHPDVLKHIDEAIAYLKAHGKIIVTSMGSYDYDSIKFWIDRGINMLSMGTEFGYIIAGCKETLSNMQRAFEDSRAGR
jgi:2-keto-3-deoxy-L-rhamnonate aldolase RhmA